MACLVRRLLSCCRAQSSRFFSTKKSPKQPQIYDYLVVVDFEATCDDQCPPAVMRETQEIIEFPWVVIDVKNCSIIDQKQHYVRPTINPKLTTFCSKFTGIEQSQVDNAEELPQVIATFRDYLQTSFASDQTYCLLADGDWDIRYILQHESRQKNIELTEAMRRYFDVKQEYATFFSTSPRISLKRMLDNLALPLVGRHHSGLDDCLSISGIVLHLLAQGHVFQHPKSVSPSHDPLADPLFARDWNLERALNTLPQGFDADRTLVLQNLPPETDETLVRNFFQPLNITNVQLLKSAQGRFLGVGHVEFKSPYLIPAALQKNNRQMAPSSRFVQVSVFKNSRPR
eukprot:TRINITY_DN4689_c0_g2_i3.p1 TRINITY_DN4689_c0_g2~~TRINITY_DN4689_c0_g2_i3.p1  ORF type:complete len:343 (+),score=21.65 TRINITY_DN4689_c0_g2_i3:67-1095(+)